MATFYVKDFVDTTFDAFLHQKNEASIQEPSIQEPIIQEPIIQELITKPIVLPTVSITIKTLTGKHIPLNILNTKTILDLKKELYKLEEIFLDDQKYIFNGKQLENDYTINHYNISDGDTIHLVLRLRGGMFHISSARKDYEAISRNYNEKFQITTRMLYDLKKYNIQMELLNELEQRLIYTKNDEEINILHDLIKGVYVG